MSDAKHTPGPWRYIEGLAHKHYVESPCGDLRVDLQEMHALDGRAVPAEANARLIAAAPDHALIASALVSGLARWDSATEEVCVAGLRYATKLDEFGVPEMHSVLRTAIAKARGEA